ncbi:MAG TPA: YicC/YloC family endoribonuclease [Steroidobacteraceae bacterium]|jgi:uncharacterized protein (TIGR00255 family)|nr:YicC/YloC family endoribonuclease [Steroidobacteraceae bacterium]
MIASMTGFARREVASPFGSLVCELRSVNHRFLDATLRMPDACRGLEPELRAAVGRTLKRGKVDCTVSLRGTDPTSANLEIDEAALERVLARLRVLSAAVREPAQLDLIELLRFPGVLRQDVLDSDALFESVRELFAATLADLAAARLREGERLSGLIEQRCRLLGDMIALVRAHLPEARAALRQRFDERLAELKVAADQDRIEQEILLILQRSDISEELDRLEGHIEETLRTLRGDEPAGRRLDFLMQEFNREANTLSSKSQDLQTTRAAVEMKVLIEQMREQVQNIE